MLRKNQQGAETSNPMNEQSNPYDLLLHMAPSRFPEGRRWCLKLVQGTTYSPIDYPVPTMPAGKPGPGVKFVSTGNRKVSEVLKPSRMVSRSPSIVYRFGDPAVDLI